MVYFVGIDISQRQVSICVLDQEGKRLWRGKCLTDPAVITATLQEKVPAGAMSLGLETGPLSPWLVHSLRQAGHTVVCLDARAVHAALSTRINKNDPNDAEGLAQILRLGWYRPVHVIPNPVDACGEWRDGVGWSDVSPSIGCSPEHGGAGPALSSGPAAH